MQFISFRFLVCVSSCALPHSAARQARRESVLPRRTEGLENSASCLLTGSLVHSCRALPTRSLAHVCLARPYPSLTDTKRAYFLSRQSQSSQYM